MRADHGQFDKALGRMVGTRGARALRPLTSHPYTPPPEPAHWPQQLHVLECVDAALRVALQARPRSGPYRAYLLEWVDQVDTTPNALTPHAVRGARPDYANPKLVTTPFPDAAPSAKTTPFSSRVPSAPPTSRASSRTSCTCGPSRSSPRRCSTSPPTCVRGCGARHARDARRSRASSARTASCPKHAALSGTWGTCSSASSGRTSSPPTTNTPPTRSGRPRSLRRRTLRRRSPLRRRSRPPLARLR